LAAAAATAKKKATVMATLNILEKGVLKSGCEREKRRKQQQQTTRKAFTQCHFFVDV
jgi:hypothetical protein